MDTGSALLAAVVADIDADTPRLVYADWLDENGESARAEFIRVQIELATLGDDGIITYPPHGLAAPTPRDRDPRVQTPRRRQSNLLMAKRDTWSPTGRLALYPTWRRGFISVLHPCTGGVYDDALTELAAYPTAEELGLGMSFTDAEFAHMPDLPNLRAFDIGGNAQLTEASAPRIGRWRTLRRLALGYRWDADEFLPHLTGLGELRELSLSHTASTDVALDHLAAFPHLESLDLTFTFVTGRNLAALATLPELRTLTLNETAVWLDGVAGLAGCQTLEELRLVPSEIERPLGDADVAPLLGLPALRLLDLGWWCELSAGCVATLRARPAMRELWVNGQLA